MRAQRFSLTVASRPAASVRYWVQSRRKRRIAFRGKADIVQGKAVIKKRPLIPKADIRSPFRSAGLSRYDAMSVAL
jgi:hypothetical protein